MATFHFDLLNGEGFLRDEEGRELPDREAALRKAEDEVRALAASEIVEGKPLVLASYISLREENGSEFKRVYFRDVIEIRE